ncbi:energy transducer TonB [Bdellovibrio bacteriovorus]|uniref:Energy transducer TonB n=1 Tax=Bdellovibrio bacteriovorus TaxID=959 RepID=A0A161PR93_BDEBC|nr:cell envelope integrity protein TolA [Bdellovibrio bacteriovorus]KYG69293.1 energy transducer TonB [Bdellovibrio bacteriovorus]
MMKSPSFRMYVLLSLVFHVLVLGTFLVVESLTPETPKTETVDINFLSPEDLQKMQQVEAALKKQALSRNQIVEQSETSANEEVPENARFLSAKNQKVEKQTQAANRGEFQNLKKAAPQKTGPKGDGKQKNLAKSEESKKQIAKDLFKTFDATEALERQKLADKESGLGEGRGSGEQNTGTGAETSQTNDYLKDVNVGLETVLNTREFKYYSYYNRIRKQLAQHWEGRVRDKLSKMFKEGRAPAATNQDRITKLMIVLNDKGTLVRVQVISDSGVRDLDDAAIEAFRAAAPFPNPPKGIVEGDGTVKIRWDFVLET